MDKLDKTLVNKFLKCMWSNYEIKYVLVFFYFKINM